MSSNTIPITSKKSNTRKIKGTAKYDTTNVGYGSFPAIEIYKNSPITRTKSAVKPEFANLVHLIKVLAWSYKIFPVKEPLEFTLGFTERENEMEVL